jgi:hypothetical protein
MHMQVNTNQIGFFYQLFTRSTAGLILLSVIALPLPGCGEQEGGGPIISSLSTLANDPVSAEGGDDPNVESNTPTSSEDDHQATDLVEPETEDPELFANIAASDEADDPEISLTSTPTGVTARLIWDASTDPNVSGYHVYYGKQSSGEYGSCSYEEGQTVEAPPAEINGLEPNTPYFFAISAYGGEGGEAESPCSNEVLLITPPAQT